MERNSPWPRAWPPPPASLGSGRCWGTRPRKPSAWAAHAGEKRSARAHTLLRVWAPRSLRAAVLPGHGLVGHAAGKAAMLTLPSAQPPMLKREPVTRLPHSWPRRRDDVTEAKKDQGGKESPEQELETQARHPGKFPLKSAARQGVSMATGPPGVAGAWVEGNPPPRVLPPPPVDSVLTDAF